MHVYTNLFVYNWEKQEKIIVFHEFFSYQLDKKEGGELLGKVLGQEETGFFSDIGKRL